MESKRRLSVSLAALAAVGLLVCLIGCGGEASGRAFVADVGADTAGSPTASNGDAVIAPDFALESLGGEQVRLSDSSGKVRLIDFWATWCAPCREEIPMLNELQASYGERGFQILAIADEEQDVIRDFVEEYGVEYLNLVGTEDVSAAYGVLGLPAAYLLDGEGRVIETFLGPKPRSVLVKKIEALLGPASST
jgi:thiol-disulfide isomerase/thioredoxin